MKKNRFLVVNMMSIAGLFGVFCVTAVIVITFGARIFASAGNDIENHFTGPTSLYYINEKIRQNDAGDSIYIKEVEDNVALFIPSADDEGYEYCIYYSDGFLREIYLAEGADIVVGSGQQLVEVQGLTFYEENEMFKATVVTADSSQYSMVFDGITY